MSLTTEQRVVFMDVIADSLRVSQRTHLFNWLQGEFQYLIGHEVMICGVKSSENDTYVYEYFTSTRYFNDVQFNEAIKQDTGLVSQAIDLWKNKISPVFITNQLKPADYKNYSIFNLSEAELKNSEMKSLAAHGFGNHNSQISTFVIFARLHKAPSATNAKILELIMPHLHCALIRVTSNKANTLHGPSKDSKKITLRESEILQWVHMGKTNWEISSILDISPLTVKNHVQNILRKLDVQNRGQAAVKAAKLGLVKILN